MPISRGGSRRDGQGRATFSQGPFNARAHADKHHVALPLAHVIAGHPVRVIVDLAKELKVELSS